MNMVTFKRSSASIVKMALITVALFGLSSQRAQASQIEQTWSVGPHDTTFSANHDFQQFNTSLGTLNSITIQLTGDLNTEFKFTAKGAHDVQATVNTEFTLSYGSETASATAMFDTTEISSSKGEQLYIAETNSAQIIIHPIDLAAFMGPGTINFLLDSVGQYFIKNSANVQYELNSSAASTIVVQYNYTPTAAVPEPSSFVLLGLGCLAITACRRFRRSGIHAHSGA